MKIVSMMKRAVTLFLVATASLAAAGCARHERLRAAFGIGALEPVNAATIERKIAQKFGPRAELNQIWDSIPATDAWGPSFLPWPDPPRWVRSRLSGGGILLESLDDSGMRGVKSRYLIVELAGSDGRFSTVQLSKRYGMLSSAWGSKAAKQE